jgi:hypothetical protein
MLCADVSEHSVCPIFIGGEDGTYKSAPKPWHKIQMQRNIPKERINFIYYIKFKTADCNFTTFQPVSLYIHHMM